jgi:type II secretory pathway pseudopilin PulG
VPRHRNVDFATAGYGIVETSVVVAVVAVLIFVVVTHYSRNLSESRETAIRSELATLRNTINLFTAVKGRCPTTLQELVSAEYALPYKAGIAEPIKDESGKIEIREKVFFDPKYLEAYAVDAEGNILDPFGNPYVYEPKECTVHTGSPGYEGL